MKLERLLGIIMVLMNRDKVSASQLAEMFEVTTRTIYRDIEAISMAGIPIVTYPGARGGVGIMETYKIKQQFFTPSELSTVIMGLNSVGTVLASREIIGIQEKIKQLAPNQRNENKELFHVDLTNWMNHAEQEEELEQIKEGISRSRMIEFIYQSKQGKDKRKIEPYQLMLKEGRWYVYGYCMGREDFRLFKLIRMEEVMLGESFIPREFDARKLGSTQWMKPKLIEIKLIITSGLYEEMLERCGKERMEQLEAGKWLVRFPFVDDDLGYRILMGYGSECTCIEPAEIREKLKVKIEEMMKLYQ